MSEHEITETLETSCCIVGGGPAGAVLALILARQKFPVVLLEAHEDFERDFRGDTIHPSVLEIMDELGLAERLHELRHSKIRTGTFMTPAGPLTVADFGRLKTRFPYIMMLPQAHFLEFITEEAKQYPNFQLRMGARVEELIEENGTVRGVRYEDDAGWHEVRAALTVAADGRSSRVRHLTGMEAVKTSPPMDVLWFRLPRKAGDPEGLLARFGGGHLVVMLDRLDEWQIAYVIFKGSFKEIRAAGVDALRKSLASIAPDMADRVEQLKDWKQVALLSVESSRLKEWYKPGLLLIGDAAHVMSPVGGVGINYAIQDAVVAANLLAEPLRAGKVEVRHLRAVQRVRELPTRFIQRVQAFAQRFIIANALNSNQPVRVPLFLRLLLRTPILRNIPARIIAFGLKRVHVKPSLRAQT
ncbi:MAG TPA: FAD-dependent oxidoreductase [Pyrinomonadaceae bacterium]|nr:FAD-dependent oxidoreductase [Pyrinomonadaceae bacterium]